MHTPRYASNSAVVLPYCQKLIEQFTCLNYSPESCFGLYQPGCAVQVAFRCLARVPFCCHPHLQLVCRSWRAALRSPDLFKARLEGPMAIVRGEPYVLSNGLIMKQQRGNLPDRTVSSASEFQSRIGFGMIGLGDEIYVIGGVIGPGPRNQCIKQLSDVDVLTVRSERPAWHPVAPMTHCCGSILGCALLRI
ncbi:hypothetical protein J5N97_009933 [Dioscorea zingiberensis]|uniref:F-box domain-containing protein n=1 Tax=Dioscorea zingiberensis TaxID=325984 RepID=A0A9D5HMB1_9LILI|nr:hypothetical protein J5N97_009933 [Dioscorea zingiberensis]